jgi:hypothetical protein
LIAEVIKGKVINTRAMPGNQLVYNIDLKKETEENKDMQKPSY